MIRIGVVLLVLSLTVAAIAAVLYALGARLQSEVAAFVAVLDGVTGVTLLAAGVLA